MAVDAACGGLRMILVLVMLWVTCLQGLRRWLNEQAHECLHLPEVDECSIM